MNAMTGTIVPLHEPSFADVIAAIEAAEDLPAALRAQWACALRRLAKAIGKEPWELAARWIAVRWLMAALHHAQLGLEPRTLANYRASAKAALAWFCRAEGVPRRGAPLSPAWRKLAASIGMGLHRKTLLAFMRFCSANGITPEEVDEAVVDRFLAYRAEHTNLKIGIATRRALGRAWNGCVGSIPEWPQLRLVEPPLQQPGIGLDELPPVLRADIETYLGSLAKARRGRRKRLPPSKPSTIDTRRREIMAFIGKAVGCGFPLDSMTSLPELLRVDLIETVLDAYWAQNGNIPSVYTIDLSWKVLDMARSMAVLSAEEIEKLDDFRAGLEQHRRSGLTEKNRSVIRQVLVQDVWRSVMQLPARLMDMAERQHDHAPTRAAVLAGVAVAIQILIHAPVRIGNLAAVEIGSNLIRPGGDKSGYWLVFPDYDVKNQVPLEFTLTAETSAMLDRYVSRFRPHLLRGLSSKWLFPGETGNHKDAAVLSTQISDLVHRETGITITAHQFRHAAAAIFLRRRPGEYELVRRLLGHRSVQTTMRFYAGLETLEATRLFSEIVEADFRQDLEEPAPPTKLSRRKGRG